MARATRRRRSSLVLSAADEVAALHGDGWYLGSGIDDCDTTCAIAGLLCSEDKLLEHNRELASQEQARLVLKRPLHAPPLACLGAGGGNGEAVI